MLRLPFFRATQWLYKFWSSFVYLHSLQEPFLGNLKRESKMKKHKKVPACKNLHSLVTVLYLICLSVMMMKSLNLMNKELMGWALDGAGTRSAKMFCPLLKLPTNMQLWTLWLGLPDISLNGSWWNSLVDHTILRGNLQGNFLAFCVEDNNNCQGIRSSEPNELKWRFFTCFYFYSLWAWRHKLAEVTKMIKHWLQITQNI